MDLNADAIQLTQRIRELEAEVQTLRREVQRQRAVNQRWAQLAGTDNLTGLPNKIAFLRALVPQDIQYAQVAGDPIGFILLSGDNLGPINENYGRDAGDQVLRGLSEFLQSVLKGEERLGHIDGTHFAVAFYPASLEDARERAEMLRAQIEKHMFPCANTEIQITASIGVTSVESSSITDSKTVAEEILHLLSGALYQAKQAGGNRVEIAQQKSGSED